jgi:hypothetical protein
MSVKFQVTLPEALMAELKRAAEEMGVSAAEFIRQTMSDRLSRSSQGPEIDPFGPITRLVESEESDLASQIDEVLYR